MLYHYSFSDSTLLHIPGVDDPFNLVAEDLSTFSENMKSILGVDHPVLSTVAKYFFELDGGKKIRPVMTILISRAIAAHKLSLNLPEGMYFTTITCCLI